MINAVIIEDNDEALDYFSSLLNKNFSNISVKGSAKSIKKGVELIKMQLPDIVFLDIELKDGLGFDILDEFGNYSFEVVFTTAFDNYYQKAIEHFAFHYLLKPIDTEVLRKVIDRYKKVRGNSFSQENYSNFKEFIKDQNSKILLNTGKEHVAVSLDEIVLCKADGNYTNFILASGKTFLASNGLKYYYELLSHKGFFRASRFSLINTSHIKSIYKKETIILSNNTKVNVSVRNKGNLTELIDSLS